MSWDLGLVMCSFVHLCCILNHYPCCVSVFPATLTAVKPVALSGTSRGGGAAKDWAVHGDLGDP